MTTKTCKVVGGQNGYVPVYSNSHGGLPLGKAYNEKIVYQITSTPEEYGYVQLDARVVQDLAPEIKVSETKQYWIEKTHLVDVIINPPATQTKKFKLVNYDFGTKVIEVEELQ